MLLENPNVSVMSLSVISEFGNVSACGCYHGGDVCVSSRGISDVNYLHIWALFSVSDVSLQVPGTVGGVSDISDLQIWAIFFSDVSTEVPDRRMADRQAFCKLIVRYLPENSRFTSSQRVA